MIEIPYNVPQSSSFFILQWEPSHPNIIRDYDSYRMRKKKIKRWPPVEEMKDSYMWFWTDKNCLYPFFMIEPNIDCKLRSLSSERNEKINIDILSTDSEEMVSDKVKNSLELK